jgi:predicted O-methyltransferase YrrM
METPGAPQPPAELSHADACIALTQTLVEYRHQPISAKLRTIHEKHSMLHVDVLTILYHFARICEGQILEVGPYVGGSSISMALGARESQRQPKAVTSIEPGGKLLEHNRVPSADILADLKKNLVKREVADLVTIIEGYSWKKDIIKKIHDRFAPGEIGLFFVDADGQAGRDYNAFRPLLSERCFVVIDDYFGPASKSLPTVAQVDELVASGELLPLGVHGWGTWVGQRRSSKSPA